MRWRRSGTRTGLIGVVATSLLAGALLLGLRLPGLTAVPGFPDSRSVDYSAPPAGGFAPLRIGFLQRVLGLAAPPAVAAAPGDPRVHVPRPLRGHPAVIEEHPFTNDNFAAARPIASLPYNGATSTRGASRESSEPKSCGIVSGGSVWYRYSAAKSEGLEATTEGSNYATALAVYTGPSIAELTQVGCTSDATGQSKIAFPALRGTEYFFQISDEISGGRLVFGLHRRSVLSAMSISADSGKGGAVSHPAVSSNGRWVVFNSNSQSLDSRCHACGTQVYVRDVETGTVELISVSNDGSPANKVGSAEGEADITADGRYVVFTSAATNLVAGDTNDRRDVFLRDRVRRTTRRISISRTGEQARSGTFHASIADDGSAAAMWTYGDVSWDPAYPHMSGVYWLDLRTGEFKLAGVDGEGRASDPPAAAPQISPDGRSVAFLSQDVNLTPKGPGPVVTAITLWNTLAGPSPVYAQFWDGHVYVHNMSTGSTVDVCTNAAGDPIEGSCAGGHMSWDARSVVFNSSSESLASAQNIPADRTGLEQIYVKDLRSGAVELVSQSSSGESGGDASSSLAAMPGVRDAHNQTGLHDPRRTPNDTNRFESISNDGRFVSFDSEASTLVEGDTNSLQDVFRRDRLTGRTIRVSMTSAGLQSSGRGFMPSVSGDGQSVVFISDDDGLVAGDKNGMPDVFLWFA